MEGIENLTKGGVSLVQLPGLYEKAMEDGVIDWKDTPVLIDLGEIVPGIMALKDAGGELLDLDDDEHVTFVKAIEEAAGAGAYSEIGADVIAALAAIGNVVEGIRAARAAKKGETG